MYTHRQTGWVIIGIIGAIVLWIAYSAPARAWDSMAFLSGIIFTCLVGILFSSLNVEETGDHLKVSFGPGLIWKNIPFADIYSCRQRTTVWYNGYGIRMVSGGWLFNVSGNKSVELTMHSGKVYQIGTDEPDRLLAVVQRRLETMPNTAPPTS